MTRLDLDLASTLDEIPRLADEVDSFAEAHDLPPKLAFQLNLALEELITNIVTYAYADAPPSAAVGHVIHVGLELVDGSVRVEVEDDGRPFDPFHDSPAPDLEADLDERAVGGLGVHLIKTFMDEAHYRREDERNRVTLVVKAAAG